MIRSRLLYLRLFAAMRVYRSGGKLDAGLIAPLVVFLPKI